VRKQQWVRKWNASEKAKMARERWINNNPRRAWVVAAMSGAKKRAKQKGLEFNITLADILPITSTHCPVFGTQFLFQGGKVIRPDSPSLDRLDPKKGYVKGNVVVISIKANNIKSAYAAEDIAKVAEWLASYAL